MIPNDFTDRLWDTLVGIRDRVRYSREEWITGLLHDLLLELQALSDGLLRINRTDLSPLKRKHEQALIALKRCQQDEISAELATSTEYYVRDNLIEPPSIARGNEIDERLREIIVAVLIRHEEIDGLLAKEIAVRQTEEASEAADDVAFA